jgi:hypothetical protein
MESSEGDRGGVSQWLNGTVAAMGRRGKGQLTRRDTSFKGRTRRWPRAAEMVGATASESGR